jgi:hypothetical protein
MPTVIKIRIPEGCKQMDAIKSAVQNALPGARIETYIGNLSVISIDPDPGADAVASVENSLARFRG